MKIVWHFSRNASIQGQTQQLQSPFTSESILALFLGPHQLHYYRIAL